MAKSRNQKGKLLYLAEIFHRETDETHGLTLAELTERLAAYGVQAERKTLYADMEELRRCGLDIDSWKEGREYRYRLASREFELPELKLLVDAVQASRFITESKSRSLIKKLESLVSVHDARQLQRQVLIAGRVKTMNESIYYNIDKLHTAIGEGSRSVSSTFSGRWRRRKRCAGTAGGTASAHGICGGTTRTTTSLPMTPRRTG